MGAGGIRINQVRPGGPFHKLGLQQGDIILSINDVAPGADLSLEQAVAQTPHGDTALKLEVNRRGLVDLIYYQMDP